MRPASAAGCTRRRSSGPGRSGCSPRRCAPPLLLPPGRGDPVGAPLELATEGDRGVPDVDEVPARLDPHVDVHAPVAAGLREAGQPQLGEQVPGDERHPGRVAEVGARLGVEVDPQLVGVVGVVPAARPRVEGQRAHLGRPRDHGHLGRAQLVGGPARTGRSRWPTRRTTGRPASSASGRTRPPRGPAGRWPAASRRGPPWASAQARSAGPAARASCRPRRRRSTPPPAAWSPRRSIRSPRRSPGPGWTRAPRGRRHPPRSRRSPCPHPSRPSTVGAPASGRPVGLRS